MSKHQKSLSSPKTYPIKRKERPWTIKPSPGPHSEENCIPLGIIIRDVLEYAENISEVKKVLEEGKCEIDGKVVRDHRFPVGIFDSLRLGEKYFRIIPHKKGFKLININKKDAGKKLCRIEDKKTVDGGKLQIIFNDGKSIMTHDEELMNLQTGTSVILSVPEKKCTETIKSEKGKEVMITNGKNRGAVASFEERKVLKGSRENRIIVSQEGKKIDLPEDIVFPIDTEKIKIEEQK